MKFQYAYTRLHVKDCRACYEFYHDVLGLEATFASEIDRYVELTDGKVKLTLLNQSQMKEYMGTKTEFSFKTQSDRIALSFEVADVEEACQYLQGKGVKIISPPWNVIDWGMKLAYIRDPEGNLIEIFESAGMVGAE